MRQHKCCLKKYHIQEEYTMKKFVSLLLVVMMAIVPFAGNAATLSLIHI